MQSLIVIKNKNDLTNRWSDAMDNWDLRQEIDKDDSKVTKMTSTTDPFSIGIELVGENSYSYENKSYVINGVDFGLAERPRQSIEIKKEGWKDIQKIIPVLNKYRSQG